MPTGSYDLQSHRIRVRSEEVGWIAWGRKVCSLAIAREAFSRCADAERPLKALRFVHLLVPDFGMGNATQSYSLPYCRTDVNAPLDFRVFGTYTRQVYIFRNLDFLCTGGLPGLPEILRSPIPSEPAHVGPFSP